MTKLTAKQEAFCQEYIKDFNAGRAAAAAGYSEKTAYSIGSENLTKPEINLRVAELIKDRQESVKIDAEYVLKRLVEIDQMDVKDILKDDGSVRPVSEWPKVWTQTLSGLDVSELFEGSGEDREQIGLLKKIKWPDKVKNLELLGKHTDVRAFMDRAEVVNVEMTHEEWLNSLDDDKDSE